MPPSDDTRPSVALIGFRGAGKTTVGRILSRMTGLPLIDTDEWIAAQTGLTLAEIFRLKGEAEFRRLEVAAVTAACAASPAILSVGGGAIEDGESVRRLRAVAKVVWLRAGERTLQARIDTDPLTESHRPALAGTDSPAQVRETLNRRTPLYAAAADVTMDTDGVEPEGVAARVVERLRLSGP
ncbi:MAG: shikimate kinase [Phycisphaerales bacterium]|nr:MAG: shikimate kinase [Phycisphaerales bacterium]